MEPIEVFRRYELKYILEEQQYRELMNLVNRYMVDDEFHLSSIYNIYYDTSTYLLIRNSLDKPVYKEKVRVRSYRSVNENGQVFAELKKKFEDVVYKRRIETDWKTAESIMCQKQEFKDTQIGREVSETVHFYKTLRPVMFLGYEREAYAGMDDPQLRVTFDRNIVYRTGNIQLRRSTEDRKLIEDGKVLMEVKSTGAIPLWMTHFLDRNRIYRTSFSKYGSAYMNEYEAGRIQI